MIHPAKFDSYGLSHHLRASRSGAWYDFPAMEDPKVIIERRLLYDAGGNSGVQSELRSFM